MTMYAGDEFYDDDVTSGPLDEHHEWGTNPDVDEFAGEERDQPKWLAQTVRQCPECKRAFNLLDPEDADEWLNGHDCE